MSRQAGSAFGDESQSLAGNHAKPHARPATEFIRSLLQIAAILGVAAAIAGFWGHTNWILDLLSQLRVQWAIGLSVLILLFALARSWPWVLLCVIGFAINAIPIWPYAAGLVGSRETSSVTAADSNDASKAQLRLMSLNVLTRNRNWDGVIESVLESSPDFLVLMEIDSVWQQICETQLAQDYPYAIYKSREDNFGIAFLSKVPFSQSEVFESRTLELPSIDVTFSNLGQTPLRIIATHPIPPMDQQRWAARNEQLANVAARFDDSTNNVMVGDFNLTPWSPCFKKAFAGTDLQDASETFGLTPTWHVFPTWIGGLKIDHALISNKVIARRLEIGQDVGSDHLALILDFGF